MILAAACWISPGLAGAQENAPEPEEKVAAVVNGEVIPMGRLDREMSGYQTKLMRSGQMLTKDKLEALKQGVLESLIDRALLYQESVKQGIEVKPEEIEEQWVRIRERFDSEEAFQQAMIRMNTDEETIRDEIRRVRTVKTFIQGRFAQGAAISEEEARAFYDTHQESFNRPEQIRARHILIRPESGGGEQAEKDARSRLEALREEAEAGADFAELAGKHSQGPSGKRGGDLGYFSRGDMAKPFEDAAFALKEPGELSQVVRTQFGYHLIKLEDRKEGGLVPFEEVQENLQEYLRKEKVKEAVQSYVKQLRQEAEIKRFHDQESKDG
jgi:peptidyl-prolyl cis-trans isomerase C